MDELGVGVLGGDGGDGLDLGLPHEDGVALDVAEALGLADHPGVEDLDRVVLGHGPGDDPAGGVLARQDDVHLRLGGLAAVGEELFGDDGLAAGPYHDLGVALGGVHAPDLGGLHVDGGALVQVDDGLGVEDALAGALALAVVLLVVADLGVFAHVEGVDAVVLGGVTAGVVDAAAGDDVHVAVLADVEVVVDRLGEAGLGEDHGNVDRLLLGAGSDVDVDAGLVGLGVDDDVGGADAAVRFAVLADIVGPHRKTVQIGDLLEELGFQFVHGSNASFPGRGCGAAVSENGPEAQAPCI